MLQEWLKVYTVDNKQLVKSHLVVTDVVQVCAIINEIVSMTG